MDITNFTDNKIFWKHVYPLFSDKGKTHDKINIVEGETIITEAEKGAEIMNHFYSTAVENLGIKQVTGFEKNVDGFEDPVEAAINKFSNHPSILKIKEMANDKDVEQFNFARISTEKMENYS